MSAPEMDAFSHFSQNTANGSFVLIGICGCKPLGTQAYADISAMPKDFTVVCQQKTHHKWPEVVIAEVLKAAIATLAPKKKEVKALLASWTTMVEYFPGQSNAVALQRIDIEEDAVDESGSREGTPVQGDSPGAAMTALVPIKKSGHVVVVGSDRVPQSAVLALKAKIEAARGLQWAHRILHLAKDLLYYVGPHVLIDGVRIYIAMRSKNSFQIYTALHTTLSKYLPDTLRDTVAPVGVDLLTQALSNTKLDADLDAIQRKFHVNTPAPNPSQTGVITASASHPMQIRSTFISAANSSQNEHIDISTAKPLPAGLCIPSATNETDVEVAGLQRRRSNRQAK